MLAFCFWFCFCFLFVFLNQSLPSKRPPWGLEPAPIALLSPRTGELTKLCLNPWLHSWTIVIFLSSWWTSLHGYSTDDSDQYIKKKKKGFHLHSLNSSFKKVFMYFTYLYWAKVYNVDHLPSKYLLRANDREETGPETGTYRWQKQKNNRSRPEFIFCWTAMENKHVKHLLCYHVIKLWGKIKQMKRLWGEQMFDMFYKQQRSLMGLTQNEREEISSKIQRDELTSYGCSQSTLSS